MGGGSEQDSEVSAMLTELSALNTVPLDAAACAKVMMTAATLAGLFFLASLITNLRP